MWSTNAARQHLLRAESAGELAWLALELCHLSIQARAMGWCLGEIAPAELTLCTGQLTLVPVRPGLLGVWNRDDRRRRRYRHLHRGHDTSCTTIGIPLTACRATLASWDSCVALPLIYEAIEDAVEEVRAALQRGTSWAAETAWESVRFAVQQRVSIRPIR